MVLDNYLALLTSFDNGDEGIDKKIGAQIREIRKGWEIHQIELGERIGLSFQQIQKYEKGADREDRRSTGRQVKQPNLNIHKSTRAWRHLFFQVYKNLNTC